MIQLLGKIQRQKRESPKAAEVRIGEVNSAARRLFGQSCSLRGDFSDAITSVGQIRKSGPRKVSSKPLQMYNFKMKNKINSCFDPVFMTHSECVSLD